MAMINFIIVLAVLAWRSIPCSGLPGVTQPTTTQADPHEPAWSPRPTQAPAFAQKRDVAGNRTCGFVNGEIVSPLTCNNALQKCVVDENAAVAGCCGTTTIDQSSTYFVECGFYIGCIDYFHSNPLTNLSGFATSTLSSDVAGVSGASVSVSSPVQSTLSCSAVSPFCATYSFIYGELTYSIVGCTNNIGSLSLQPLPNLPTYRQLPETVPPSLTSSSPSSHTPTNSHAATLSGKELAEIIAPSVFGGLSILVALISCMRIRRRKKNNPHDYPPHYSSARYLERYPVRYPADQLSFFPPQGRLSIEEWKSRYLISTSKEVNFLTFLSSYGRSGVPLRELIMLGTLRLSGEKSKNHWLGNGEVGSLQEATHDIVPEIRNHSFLVDNFMEAISSRSNIELFQARLESLGLIDVRYPKGTPFDTACQYWHIDQRVWIIREDQSNGLSDITNDPHIVQKLLDVFMEIPDKDVSPAAQRQREFYYHHAHLLVRRVMRFQRRLGDDPLFLSQLVFVILQLLTHRYQEGDALLFELAHEISMRYGGPSRKVMLLWAELKDKAFREDYDGLCLVRDRLLDLETSNEAFSRTESRQNGLLGFLLVDLMNAAKAAHFEDIVSDAIKAGTEWVDRTTTRESTLERTALCEALATFEIHDRKEAIPQKYHLFYGYHLSRAGLLVQGDSFLASGLQYYDFDLKYWSYEIERVSIALRLDRQKEAAQILASIRDRALYNRGYDYSSDLWKKSGECAEIFVLLDLYQADSSASAGRLDDACANLKSGITITSSMHDAYIATLRITLEMRLLEVRLWQQNLKEALLVALELARELTDQRTRSNLALDMIYGIGQLLLDLSNILLSTGDAAASLKLLEHIKSIRAYLPSVLSEELITYVQQRVATVHRFREDSELPSQESNARTLEIGTEDPITQAGTDLGYNNDPAILKSENATAGTNASLGLHPSDRSRPKLSEPTHLQRSKILPVRTSPSRTSRHTSALVELLRAPRPPTTELGTYVTGSEEKASRPDEDPLQIEL